MGEETMTKEEQATMLIDRLVDIQRIKNSDDRDKEINKQEKILSAKLEALGIPVGRLLED